MQTLVSVIIPCFNGENVIDKSIKSIFEQKYNEIELIVVDDGSTDDSKKKIKKWENQFVKKGYLFKYIYQENRGLGGAIDTGLKYVTGSYLTLLDADDYFLPGSISKKAKFLDEHPKYAGVRSNGWMVKGQEKKLFIIDENEKEINDLFTALIFGKTNNWAGTYMVRTDILFDFYPNRNIFPSRFGQNMQIILPVAYKRKFGYIDEPLMVYELHENSLSQADSEIKQYSKEEKNARGYREIYIHMLNCIIKDSKELNMYLNAFNASYHRSSMLRAIAYNKVTEMRKHYKELANTNFLTLNDRIVYYSKKNILIAILLKFIRKIKIVFNLYNEG